MCACVMNCCRCVELFASHQARCDRARAAYAKVQTPRFGPVVAKETFEAGESSNAPRMLRSQSELQTELHSGRRGSGAATR